MHFECQMQLVIPDVMNAAVGIPDALHIVLRILDVLDTDEFYQSLQTLQTSPNHPVAGLGCNGGVQTRWSCFHATV